MQLTIRYNFSKKIYQTFKCTIIFKSIRKCGSVFLLILLAALNVLNGAPSPKTPFSPPSPSRLGKYKTAAVTSDGVPCSDIGR